MSIENNAISIYSLCAQPKVQLLYTNNKIKRKNIKVQLLPIECFAAIKFQTLTFRGLQMLLLPPFSLQPFRKSDIERWFYRKWLQNWVLLVRRHRLPGIMQNAKCIDLTKVQLVLKVGQKGFYVSVCSRM